MTTYHNVLILLIDAILAWIKSLQICEVLKRCQIYVRYTSQLKAKNCKGMWTNWHNVAGGITSGISAYCTLIFSPRPAQNTISILLQKWRSPTGLTPLPDQTKVLRSPGGEYPRKNERAYCTGRLGIQWLDFITRTTQDS